MKPFTVLVYSGLPFILLVLLPIIFGSSVETSAVEELMQRNCINSCLKDTDDSVRDCVIACSGVSPEAAMADKRASFLRLGKRKFLRLGKRQYLHLGANPIHKKASFLRLGRSNKVKKASFLRLGRFSSPSMKKVYKKASFLRLGRSQNHIVDESDDIDMMN